MTQVTGRVLQDLSKLPSQTELLQMLQAAQAKITEGSWSKKYAAVQAVMRVHLSCAK